MLWNLHILEKPCHSCESRNPEVCSQTEIRIPVPRFRGDKFREDDIYTRILILLKIYVELRLNNVGKKSQGGSIVFKSSHDIVQSIDREPAHISFFLTSFF